jgi:hypothetical protein
MTTGTTELEVPQFSRTPTGDVFGKLDDEMAPIRINSDALLEIKRKATDNGMTLAEYVRMRLYVDVFGLEHVLMLPENRIRRATSNASQGEPMQLKVVDTMLKRASA